MDDARKPARPGPVDAPHGLSLLEEMAGHALVQGHPPKDCIRVAEGWILAGRAALCPWPPREDTSHGL